jgi:hypothetical protein
MNSLSKIIFVFFILLFIAIQVFAQGASVSERLGRPPAPIETLGEARDFTVGTFVNWMIGVFWILAVGFVIWAAFLYLSAGGNEDRVLEAKKRLLYAVIAAIIALLSTGIGIITENLLRGSSSGIRGQSRSQYCSAFKSKDPCEQAGCRWGRFFGLFGWACFGR